MTESPMRQTTLYASIGSEMGWYDADVEAGTVEKRGAIQLPGNVSYAWPHPSHEYLYVGLGRPGNADPPGYLGALRIEPGSGALTMHGEPAPLEGRATHICVDNVGGYLYTAHTRPSMITVHRLEPDGTVGAQIEQPDDLDTGIFAHQVRVTPSGQSVILVCRGFDPTDTRPEAPGSLQVFSVNDGVLSNQATIAPNDGYGFGVRHLDFHPTKPWLYISVERHNEVLMFDIGAGDALPAAPRYTKGTLSTPRQPGVLQGPGAIHVDPNGRSVYLSNRSAGEGEDNIAAFAIDPATGEPTLLQHADQHSLHARTLSIDPSGRLLVAAAGRAYEVRDGDQTRIVPGGLTTFRIGDDGRLELVRKYDIDFGDAAMSWSSMIDHA